MSYQWEVVTKSKKHKNLEKPMGQTERKKLVENGPKLEEILHSHQVKSLFANLNKDKNKEKKIEKPKSVSPKKSKPVEPIKKQNNQPPPPPKPKNIESALNAISPTDLENLLDNLKASFPGSELLWLKGVSSFLNSNLHLETDPTFSGKSPFYPSNVIPKQLKSTILDILKSSGEVNLFYFFDQLLTGLAMDMSKNQPVLGYKILLQLIAHNWPLVCCNNLAKTAILLNSYQNRSAIGLSLLWALGQGGVQDLTVGVKVWQNIMLPLIEMKHYTRYVIEYLHKSLIRLTKGKLILSQDEFFATYNALLAQKALPKDCQEMIRDSTSMLIETYIENSTKLANIFLRLFRDIEVLPQSQYQSQVVGCISCLIKNSDCFKIWKMNYKKYSLPSLELLERISSDWESLPQDFISSPNFSEFLLVITQLNNELLVGKKKDLHAEKLTKLTTNLQEKSSQKKKSSTNKSSICPWICGIFLLLGAIGGIVAYDVHNHGGVFQKSATGKFLDNTGALPYVEVAWFKTMSTSARGYKWAEENIPIYYAKASIATKPYLALSCDLFKIIRNGVCQTCETIREFFSEKSPAVVEFVESYAPGLSKKIQDVSSSAWGATVNAYQNGCAFFKTKVFVGSLSPESLGKALNQTQIIAAEYYGWFHEKVDAYAKIK